MGLKEIYKVANYYDVKYGFNKEADVSDWLYDTFVGYPKGSWEAMKDIKAFVPHQGQKLYSVKNQENMIWDGGKWVKESQWFDKNKKEYIKPEHRSDDAIIAECLAKIDEPKLEDFLIYYRPDMPIAARDLYQKCLAAWKAKYQLVIDPTITSKNPKPSDGSIGAAHDPKKLSGSVNSFFSRISALKQKAAQNIKDNPSSPLRQREQQSVNILASKAWQAYKAKKDEGKESEFDPSPFLARLRELEAQAMYQMTPENKDSKKTELYVTNISEQKKKQ